jgi:hypothetical protein
VTQHVFSTYAECALKVFRFHSAMCLNIRRQGPSSLSWAEPSGGTDWLHVEHSFLSCAELKIPFYKGVISSGSMCKAYVFVFSRERVGRRVYCFHNDNLGLRVISSMSLSPCPCNAGSEPEADCLIGLGSRAAASGPLLTEPSVCLVGVKSSR